MDESYEDALVALAREFTDAVPARLAALHEAVARARGPVDGAPTTGDSSGARDERIEGARAAARVAHKLHGAAGSFGQTALGAAAGDVEDVLLALVDDPDGPASAPRWAALDHALAALDACARAIAESEP